MILCRTEAQVSTLVCSFKPCLNCTPQHCACVTGPGRWRVPVYVFNPMQLCVQNGARQRTKGGVYLMLLIHQRWCAPGYVFNSVHCLFRMGPGGAPKVVCTWCYWSPTLRWAKSSRMKYLRRRTSGIWNWGNGKKPGNWTASNVIPQ